MAKRTVTAQDVINRAADIARERLRRPSWTDGLTPEQRAIADDVRKRFNSGELGRTTRSALLIALKELFGDALLPTRRGFEQWLKDEK